MRSTTSKSIKCPQGSPRRLPTRPVSRLLRLGSVPTLFQWAWAPNPRQVHCLSHRILDRSHPQQPQHPSACQQVLSAHSTTTASSQIQTATTTASLVTSTTRAGQISVFMCLLHSKLASTTAIASLDAVRLRTPEVLAIPSRILDTLSAALAPMRLFVLQARHRAMR